MSVAPDNLPPQRPPKVSFSEDFRRFFVRGLAALLPTLITIWLITWALEFLWNNIGRHLIEVVKWVWLQLTAWGLDWRPAGYIGNFWAESYLHTRIVGVLLAILVVYVVGLFVGNLIGRTFWKIGENLVMRIPIVRAIYPAAKQVTDFLLSNRSQQFAGSRVVAVHARDPNVWSIGLVTGPGLGPLSESTGQDMVTVFIPSSPTAFSGYVVVVPRSRVVELPLKVEEAMRLLISGGVLTPDEQKHLLSSGDAGRSAHPIVGAGRMQVGNGGK